MRRPRWRRPSSTSNFADVPPPAILVHSFLAAGAMPTTVNLVAACFSFFSFFFVIACPVRVYCCILSFVVFLSLQVGPLPAQNDRRTWARPISAR
jgi:hypothetical protein